MMWHRREKTGTALYLDSRQVTLCCMGRPFLALIEGNAGNVVVHDQIIFKKYGINLFLERRIAPY